MVNIPQLFGNGKDDDTGAIQYLLDNNKNVTLPFPEVNFLISRPLIIHSGQTLFLQPSARIKLAPESDCVMLTNDKHDEGNEYISIIGGIWDMDCRNQSPNPLIDGTYDAKAVIEQPYIPERYIGVLMRLVNVDHLTLKGLTLCDPVLFGVQCAKIYNFTISDITFDYKHCNPVFLNMDGIHIHGPSRFGFISNLKGATHDDMVALNCDDGPIASPSCGNIEDIVIDGLFTENCYTGVRLLSVKSVLRRINISNIFGSFRVNAVSFTSFRRHINFYPEGVPRIEDISLNNLHIRKTFGDKNGVYACGDVGGEFVDPDNIKISNLHSLIWIESGMNIGTLAINNVFRCEEEWAAPSVCIEKDAVVERLCLNNIFTSNKTDIPIEDFVNEGTVMELVK